MTLPAGFEYGDVRGGLGRWCIHRKGDALMFCGQEIYHIPEPPRQPDRESEPFEVHDECRQRMAWLLGSGICRGCGTRQPVMQGLVQGHGGCYGVNLPPKRERR